MKAFVMKLWQAVMAGVGPFAFVCGAFALSQLLRPYLGSACAVIEVLAIVGAIGWQRNHRAS